MRILFVTHNFPFPAEKDGQTLIAFHVLRHLASRHSVTLFCFGDKNDVMRQDALAKLGITVRIFPRPKKRLAGYYLRPSAQQYAWYQYRLISSELTQAIQEADTKQGADIVYLHSPMVSSYLKVIRQTPVVMGSVDAMSAWFQQFTRTESNVLKRLHYYCEYRKSLGIERTLFPLAKRVIVVSSVDQAIIKQQSSENHVTSIPNGVDCDFFRPSQSAADGNVLIFSGTMNYPPNVIAALRFYKNVWPKLKKLHPDLKWYIVGKNPTLEIFELHDRDASITVTGYVKDIRPFLWQSTIYISPLNLGTGFKNKIAEAMACGKAVVATSTSLSGFPVTDGVDVVKADTSQELCERIHELLANPELRVKIELGAKAFAQRYTWERAAAAYEQVFQEVIDGAKT